MVVTGALPALHLGVGTPAPGTEEPGTNSLGKSEVGLLPDVLGDSSQEERQLGHKWGQQLAMGGLLSDLKGLTVHCYSLGQPEVELNEGQPGGDLLPLGLPLSLRYPPALLRGLEG